MSPEKKQAANDAKRGTTRSGNRPLKGLNQPLNPFLFALIITAIFLTVVSFGLIHHEMWRDELQAWLVARDAQSITGLFQNMKYEGNPALWHFFLFIITRCTHDPAYMQVVHLIIACASVFIFNRYSELPPLQKVLFSFGYFTAYEYAVISRSYGLTLLLLFAACTLYKNRHRHYLLLGIVLALLANVTVYGIIFALALSGILVLDRAFLQEKGARGLKPLIPCLAIAAIGIALSIYQVWPEPDNSFPVNYPQGLFESDRWSYVLSRLFTTYFYIPDTRGMNFWNTNFYFDDGTPIQKPLWDWFMAHISLFLYWIILPMILFVLSLIIFIRKPLIALLYATVTLGLLYFYYATDLQFSRYCGFLLITLVVCYWLEKYYPDRTYQHRILAFLSGFGKKIQTPFLVVILTANMIGAAVAYAKDYEYPFSASKETAHYIHENKLDTMTMTGAYFYIASPLAAWLDTRLFYFQMNDLGSFCIYDQRPDWHITSTQIVMSITNLMHEGRTKLLLVSSYEWTHANGDGQPFTPLEHGLLSSDIKIDFLKSFKGGIVKDEEYYLYLVSKKDTATNSL